MFRRAFWFTTGAAAGVWATTKVQRKLRSLAPDALAVRAADKAVAGGHRLKEFALDVRAGMAQREGELNDALGLTTPPDGDAAGPGLTARADRRQLRGGPAHPPRAAGPHHRSLDRNEDH